MNAVHLLSFYIQSYVDTNGNKGKRTQTLKLLWLIWLYRPAKFDREPAEKAWTPVPYGHRKAVVDHMLGKQARKASQTLDRQNEELCKKRVYQAQSNGPELSAFDLTVETGNNLECIVR